MAFTASQAFDLLRTAFSRNRLPHALLIVGDEHQGASRLILQLLELMNGIRADHLDSVRDEYCRLVRPKSKSRRILRDDIRAVEPFLQQRAAEGKWKIAVFMDAERMNDEAANAFLKTLEEPPSQCLLILSTSQPDQLLQTIISRCVRVNLLQSAEFRLTPIQEALLPHWLETCRNLDNDLAALAFRSKFVDVMTEAKAAITKNLNQALKDEAKEAAQGTDTSDWESRNKDANTAQIETEYLEQRHQALALDMQFFELADLLIANGADVNLEIGRSDEYKNASSSLLSRHYFNPRAPQAAYLLEHGADPDYVCNDGKTLLISAARYGNEESVRFLLENGADPNKPNGKPRLGHYKPANSETALWVLADVSGLQENSINAAAKLLIEHKADVNFRSRGGATPLDRAIATGKSSLARILKEAGAKTSRELDGK